MLHLAERPHAITQRAALGDDGLIQRLAAHRLDRVTPKRADHTDLTTFHRIFDGWHFCSPQWSQSVAERGGLGDADGDAAPAGGFDGVADEDAEGVAAGDAGTVGEAGETATLGCADADGSGAAAPGTFARGVGVVVGTYTVGIADGSPGGPAGDASGEGDGALLPTGITAVPTPYV